MDWRIFNKLIDLHMYAKLQYNILQNLNIIAASRAKYVQDMCKIHVVVNVLKKWNLCKDLFQL